MGIRRWVNEGNMVLDLIFTLVLLGMFAPEPSSIESLPISSDELSRTTGLAV